MVSHRIPNISSGGEFRWTYCCNGQQWRGPPVQRDNPKRTLNRRRRLYQTLQRRAVVPQADFQIMSGEFQFPSASTGARYAAPNPEIRFDSRCGREYAVLQGM